MIALFAALILSWMPPGTNVAGYIVYSSTSNAFTQLAVTTGTNIAISQSAPSLRYYKVTAFTSNGIESLMPTQTLAVVALVIKASSTINGPRIPIVTNLVAFTNAMQFYWLDLPMPPRPPPPESWPISYVPTMMGTMPPAPPGFVLPTRKLVAPKYFER